MRFLFVVTGRNCEAYASRCLESVAALEDQDVRVAVVDDASTDGTGGIVLGDALNHGWLGIVNSKQLYALANQVAAWRALDPQDDDVIVFVDMDDRLAHPHVTDVLRDYYSRGALLTYGSYRAVPAAHPSAATCRPAEPYPLEVRAARAYRQARSCFNHLRTVSWSVLKHLTEEDLRDDSGVYWRANTDRAVMIPCLELAGDRVAFVPDVLYEYTCDGDDAVWRVMQDTLITENAQLRARTMKRRLV